MPSSTSSSELSRDLWPLRLFIGTLVLALAAMALASELLLRRVVVPQDSIGAHRALLDSTDARDAAFGDSHVARGFDARGAMVNLAYPSEGIAHMDWKMRRLFSDRTPGRIVVQADPHLFAPYRLNAPFVPYDAPGPALYLADPRHRAQLGAYWLAYLRGGFSLRSRIEPTANGALLSPGRLDLLGPRRQALEARHRSLTHLPADGAALQLAQESYGNMLDEMAQRGARLCLVSFPVSPAYRDATLRDIDPSSAARTRAIMDWLRDEAARVGAPFVDHRALFDDPRLFRDVDHLNAEGARDYGDKLMRACGFTPA